MELPTKIKILNIIYTVEYVDKPSDVDVHHRESLWGQVDYWTRSIRVFRNTLEEQSVVYTLWHEIIHAISEMLRIEMLAKGKLTDDEKSVDLLAIGISSVLLDNPDLLRAMIEEK